MKSHLMYILQINLYYHYSRFGGLINVLTKLNVKNVLKIHKKTIKIDNIHYFKYDFP